ncbi:MAG TPA: transaldolase [Thermoanaerobaculia bacterium]|nr:transaldolase [Thermoanaerobaculia bacterium]
MNLRLPPDLAAALEAARAEWRRVDGTRRLFARDATLWTGSGEDRWLGWLDAPAAARERLAEWREIAADARGFDHVLLLGMGGSSLAPEVQRAAFGRIDGHPGLHVLDSIHPTQVAAFEAATDPASCLCVVSSKSGSTLEPNLLLARQLERVAAAVGAEEAPRRFVAITDPGSSLEQLARERGFRRVVHGEPTVGGRFSALSPFGVVPAAMQGLPLESWIGRAEHALEACRAEAAEENPGADLGLLLAAAAAAGRDKLMLVTHPRIATLGVWLEQLVAESTGKRGRAVLPFEGEPLPASGRCGADRIFVALSLAGELAEGDAERLEALAAAGHPVAVADLDDALELSGEMVRWQVATAVAGARLGVDPFDQPDVEAAKVAARRLAAELERSGTLPVEPALCEEPLGALHAPPSQARVLLAGAGPRPSLAALLRAHLLRPGAGDYFALLLFCAMGPETSAAAARIRRAVGEATGAATSVGFGPRYLHSTGQAHKGGPASGVYLVVTDEPEADLAVPGQRLTLGQAIAVQALGDAEVLGERGRRVARLALRGPAERLLPALAVLVERELAAPDA